MAKETKYPVKTTEKSFDIIEFLKQSGCSGVTEIADGLDLHKSVVHNHLNTLQKRGYVSSTPDNKYKLGLKFLDLGGHIRNEMELFKISKETVKQIANETAETAILATAEDGLCVHLHRVNGSEAVNPVIIDTHTGLREHMHNTALGKSMLATHTDEEVDRIVDDHGLPSTTENTITDYQELKEEIEEIRESGIAWDDEERITGLRAVAAPIMTPNDRMLGSICVVGPRSRFSGDVFREELPTTIKKATNIIELRVSQP